MAELILTDAEKAAATWFELDDAVIGKIVKSSALKMKGFSDEQARIFGITAAMVLCGITADADADELTQEVTGFTQAGRHFGDWRIIVQRMGHKAKAQPRHDCSSGVL